MSWLLPAISAPAPSPSVTQPPSSLRRPHALLAFCLLFPRSAHGSRSHFLRSQLSCQSGFSSPTVEYGNLITLSLLLDTVFRTNSNRIGRIWLTLVVCQLGYSDSIVLLHCLPRAVPPDVVSCVLPFIPLPAPPAMEVPQKQGHGLCFSFSV